MYSHLLNSKEGSPAHAGIDLSHMPIGIRGAGFPRTRGDRPDLAAVSVAAGRVPPHTRG